MKTISNSNLRSEYIARINRVIDYIEKNLDGNLTLDILADIANFSRFHFHRIFAAMVGETINQFIRRLRIEKAANMLISNPQKSITEIAFDCGYSSSSIFSRTFKDYYGVSATEWRKRSNCNNHIADSKISQTIGNNGKDFDVSSMYIDSETFTQNWRILMNGKKEIKVEVKEMPELHVAYVRHIGPYKGDSQLFERLFTKLMKWAGPRDLFKPMETKLISMYHDDPNVTGEEKLRMSICMTVPERTKVEGEIGKMNIEAGKYAVAHFELKDSSEYEDAWNMLFGHWLPESGYQCDDKPPYELYLNDPKQHPEGIHIVDICVPVKPL